MAEFKEIKQQVQADFKVVKKALKAGELPDAALVAELNELIIQAADNLPRGQEMADNFKAQAAALKQAVEAGDTAAADKAYGFLNGMKSACHKKYLNP